MARLCDNSKKMGPLEWGRSSWSPLRLVWSSGGSEDDEPYNNLVAYACGWVARLRLPPILRPYRKKVKATYWSDSTIERMGRDWYYDTYRRDYGFSLDEGFLMVFYGTQTHDSNTARTWSYFLPWTDWRLTRHTFYDLNGEWVIELTGSELHGQESFNLQQHAEAVVPKITFKVADYDGTPLTATCYLEEREWRRGTKWCKWVSYFTTPRIRRNLSITFSAEVGPDKGSWKGGLIGTGTDVLPGETHEAAFRRFCTREHSSKNGRYKLFFVGVDNG